jgi:hypothetical protein
MTIEEKFSEWRVKNVKVIALYLQFARQAKASGRKHYGMKAIAERVRWEVMMGRAEGEEYKVNNNYTAHIARLLVLLDPSLTDLFEFRTRKK